MISSIITAFKRSFAMPQWASHIVPFSFFCIPPYHSYFETGPHPGPNLPSPGAMPHSIFQISCLWRLSNSVQNFPPRYHHSIVYFNAFIIQYLGWIFPVFIRLLCGIGLECLDYVIKTSSWSRHRNAQILSDVEFKLLES